MVDITSLKAANAQRWATMKLDPKRVEQLTVVAKRLCASEAKARYKAVERDSMVPWWIVAVIHEREAGGPPHWDRYLGNGQRLMVKTTEVPAGRGPFLDRDNDTVTQNAFLRGSCDALIDCAPWAAHNVDWTPGGALTLLEKYNGLGYAAHGQSSPYIWSGSDKYVRGKIEVDHGPIEPVVDEQDGCAPLIARMMAIDPSIKFADVKVSRPAVPLPSKIPPAAPATTPWWMALLQFIAQLFGARS